MITVENATVACVTVGPSICFEANGETYRIEMSPLELWRLRMFVDLLLTHFPERVFEEENSAMYSAQHQEFLAELKSRSSLRERAGLLQIG